MDDEWGIGDNLMVEIGKVGCGGILRDDSGLIRALFSGPVDGAYINVARLLAISYALDLFCEINWDGLFGLLVELESQVVLNWITKPNLRPWKWWHKLVSIDLLVKRAGLVEFKVVHRQSNALAFGLASDGASRDSFFKAWWTYLVLVVIGFGRGALETFIEAGLFDSVELVVESMSKVALNWINNPLQRPWLWWRILSEIDILVCRIKRVRFSFLSESGSATAVWLVKDGVRRSELFKSWW
ncbi:hypothetical protein GQ457_16G022540 [Hibiscus cannabinus]